MDSGEDEEEPREGATEKEEEDSSDESEDNSLAAEILLRINELLGQIYVSAITCSQ